MARLPRLAIAGLPHLVIQRGQETQPIFNDDADRSFYLDAMASAAKSCSVAIHAYALTNEQVCLLATPRDSDSLGRFMQRIGRLKTLPASWKDAFFPEAHDLPGN